MGESATVIVGIAQHELLPCRALKRTESHYMGRVLSTAAVSKPHLRRFEYDVTNTVDVSSVEAVRLAVYELFIRQWPGAHLDEVWLAFHDFERLFTGRMPNYEGCDTVYHDIQHTLDMTLAMARLLVGYEQTVEEAERLGSDRAILGIICALFHDAGYIRDSGDTRFDNGAEHTQYHISRSAAFLRNYLPAAGLAHMADIGAEIVHFTGYEKKVEEIQLRHPLDSMTGHLLGTADLIAQMADRCYLEKCRDRLYLEFVLGGIAIEKGGDGSRRVRYQSGIDLLLQTPDFYRQVVKKRLNVVFNKAYRYIEPLFAGANPYIEFIERNIAYLEHIIEIGAWPELRRAPPCFTVKENPVAASFALVNRRIAGMRGSEATLGQA